jgi:MFS family permease
MGQPTVLISLFGARRDRRGVVHGAILRVVLFADGIESERPDGLYRGSHRALARNAVFTVFGALSDRIGRKWLMMAACLISVLTYIPIYKAMQQAAGNNIVTVTSSKVKATGATTLTAMTADVKTGALVPAKEAAAPDVPKLVFLVFIQVIYVCMIYGPIAAYLVEAFPAKIRYTSLSLPYHIGNGVFGGLLPLIGLWTCAATVYIYAGLYYPMIVAGLTFVVGSLLLKKRTGRRFGMRWVGK